MAYHGHRVKIHDVNVACLDSIYSRMESDKEELRSDGLLLTTNYIVRRYMNLLEWIYIWQATYEKDTLYRNKHEHWLSHKLNFMVKLFFKVNIFYYYYNRFKYIVSSLWLLWKCQRNVVWFFRALMAKICLFVSQNTCTGTVLMYKMR